MTKKLLDPDDAIALHLQAEQSLRQLIRRKVYLKGKLLPGELTLARQLGVSRGTIRDAMQRLVQAGLIERRAGIGTRVVPTPVRTALSAWPSFSREMARRGVTVKNWVWHLRTRRATAEIAHALEIKAPKTIWHLHRIRGSQARPFVRFDSWFHPGLGELGELSDDQPLYDMLERITGVGPVRSDETILAAAADATLADQLQLDVGDPVLVRRRVVRDARGRAIEYAVNHYRSDSFEYSIQLDRSGR